MRLWLEGEEGEYASVCPACPATAPSPILAGEGLSSGAVLPALWQEDTCSLK